MLNNYVIKCQAIHTKQKYSQLSLFSHVTFLIPTLSPKLYGDPVNNFQEIYEHMYVHIEVYKLTIFMYLLTAQNTNIIRKQSILIFPSI